MLLNVKQRKELTAYIVDKMKKRESPSEMRYTTSNPQSLVYMDQSLTEIQADDLYSCPELHRVCIGIKEIVLTVKEFDALRLLISNHHRVLTFETPARRIWNEEYFDVMSKTIHNLISRLRHKLQISPDTPKYIVCIRGVGYKFII